MEDNIKALLNELNPADWSDEGNKLNLIAARIVDSLSDRFPLEDIESFREFFDGCDWSPSIMVWMLNKKIKIMKNQPDEPNHKPLTLFASERAWLKKELGKK